MATRETPLERLDDLLYAHFGQLTVGRSATSYAYRLGRDRGDLHWATFVWLTVLVGAFLWLVTAEAHWSWGRPALGWWWVTAAFVELRLRRTRPVAPTVADGTPEETSP